MDSTTRLYTIPAIILGVSLVIGTAIVAGSVYRVKSLTNTISVTGSAEKIVRSDTAKWTGNFSRSASAGDLKAGTGQMKQDLEKVKSYFSKNGVKAEEITVQPLAMTPLCQTEGNNYNITYDKMGGQICSFGIRGYDLQQTIVIESSDVDKVKQLAQDAIDVFASQGITYSTRGIEFYYSKLSDLRIELLAQATKDAQTRADKIVRSTGASLGNLQSASMGVIQVTAKNSLEFSDYGAYDTSALEKKVTAVVRTSFQLR